MILVIRVILILCSNYEKFSSGTDKRKIKPLMTEEIVFICIVVLVAIVTGIGTIVMIICYISMFVQIFSDIVNFFRRR